MSMSRTQKSAWNVASGLVFTVVSLSAAFFATPWLLHWLGSERFGTFKVLMDWMGYLALFEWGLGGALMTCLALKISHGDKSEVRSYLTAGMQAYLWVMPAMLIIGIGLVVALPNIVELEEATSYELLISGLIYLLPVLLTPLYIFRSLAEARQRNYILSLLMTIQTIVTTGLLIATAWAGWGLPGQSLSIAVAQIPAVLILMWDGIRGYGPIWPSPPNSSAKKELWSLSWPTFVHGFTERIGIVGDNVIIGWILGPVAVVPFYLTQRLASLVKSQLYSLGNSTWAALVNLYSQGQISTFRSRLLELTNAISGLGVALLGPIAAFNHHFISRWVGYSNFAGDAVNIIACINIWLWSIYSLWGWPVFGTGHIRLWIPYAVVFTVINVTLSIVGTLALGLIGPLLGTLISFLIINSWALPRILNQIFELSPWVLWQTALAPLTWGLPYSIILWLIAKTHTPSGWLVLAAEMGLSSLCGLFLWWNLSLNDDSRKQWRSRLRIVLGSY
jgi:O-antigen/teichoic acid export membrane protein